MTREQVYEAAFQFMKSGVGDMAKTYSRRPKVWTEVAPEEQPSIFQAQVDEDAEPPKAPGIPHRWVAKLEWYIYVSSVNDLTTPNSSILNPIIDVIEKLFPVTGIPQTLGGIVYEARISGRIRYSEMSLGAQAVALVPIRIVIPS